MSNELSFQGIGTIVPASSTTEVSRTEPSQRPIGHRVVFTDGPAATTAFLDDTTYFQYCAIEEAKSLWEGLRKSQAQFSEALQKQYDDFSTAYHQVCHSMATAERVDYDRWDQLGQSARALNVHLRQTELENLRKFAVVESTFNQVEQIVNQHKLAIASSEANIRDQQKRIEAIKETTDEASKTLSEQSQQLSHIRGMLEKQDVANLTVQVQHISRRLDEQVEQIRKGQENWANHFMANFKEILRKELEASTRPNTSMEVERVPKVPPPTHQPPQQQARPDIPQPAPRPIPQFANQTQYRE